MLLNLPILGLRSGYLGERCQSWLNILVYATETGTFEVTEYSSGVLADISAFI